MVDDLPWNYQRAADVEQWEVLCRADVMVPMPDGVRLATDMYLPARDGRPVSGRRPVILHRTPYDKTAVEAEFGYSRWFAQRGYIALVQDVRGAFGSEGEMAFIGSEGPDGAATLDWIAEQEWAAPVGTWGTTYASATQLALAAHGPTNLAAMVPQQSWTNAWRCSLRHDGAFELRWLSWVLWHSATNSRSDLRSTPQLAAALNLEAPLASDWFTRLPVRPGGSQLSLVPEYERWYTAVSTQSEFTDFWRQTGFAPELYFDRFPIADTLLLGGWYDSYSRATLEAFTGLNAAERGRVRAVMGPWVHGTTSAQTSVAGDVDFGADAAIPDLKSLHLRCFDESLDDRSTGLFTGPPLTIFVMGGGDGTRTPTGRLRHGGRWRHEREWPLARTRFTRYHLHAEGDLDPVKPAETAAASCYEYRPDRPVPTIGGNFSSLADLLPLPPGMLDTDAAGGVKRTAPIVLAGGFDQVERPDVFGCAPPYLPLASRHDVLVFRTATLSEAVELTGPIVARLWVSTSVPDTDVTAKLIDEYPPSASYPRGYALNICDGILRLRYRNGTPAEPLESGVVYAVTITLDPTSNLFAAGHRIRLDLSSSNFPKFDPNPNTGEPLSGHRRMAPATTTIHHDALHPSHILLPVIGSSR